MYILQITNEHNTAGKWGSFSVYKAFSVSNADINKKNINGFVIQKVEKTTVAYKQADDGSVSQIADIEEFTGGFTQYMNHSYYELFHIKHGESVAGDMFQNGAVLRYVKSGRKYYADDEPPTTGRIHMHGQACFIPSVESAKLKNVLGLSWSLSGNTPANGLHYREEVPSDFFDRCQSNILDHDVVVEWNTADPTSRLVTRID